MNLDEINALKETLFAQQQAISEQLAGLSRQQQELEKAARQTGIKQISDIIEEYRIPKHEIIELYKQLDLVFPRGRTGPRGAYKKEEPATNNPVLEEVTNAQETADRFVKLFLSNEAGMHLALIEEARKCKNLDQVMTLLPPQVEEFILENLL